MFTQSRRNLRECPASATKAALDRAADTLRRRFANSPNSTKRRRAIRLLATLCACGFGAFASEASAQCAAQDVLRKHTAVAKAPLSASFPVEIKSNAAVPVWKTITVGGFAHRSGLFNALDAAGCGIGDLAQDILTRPSFVLSATKTSADLVVLSPAELGARDGGASLADVYSRAQKLGFGLAASEIGPQLRLQYFDQPVGEFLYVGMEPIKSSHGESAVFVVANGGADLILIGQNVGADTKIPATWRFLFVRPTDVAHLHKQSNVSP
jgi:hypothetical protein